MPGYLVSAYSAGLPKLRAEEMLNLASVIAAGSGAAGKNGRNIIRAWERLANAGQRNRRSQYASKDELAAALASRGIKVEWQNH